MGVRGSIPSPGLNTVRFGGNTTCIEVRGNDNELIILDGGTGIFQLGQALISEFPLKANIFITHTHWDHIQGLPLFTPIFVPGNEVTIHGAADPTTQRGIGEILSRQMEYAYFPHHEPTRNDDDLERVFEEALQRNKVGSEDPTFELAREGLSVTL